MNRPLIIALDFSSKQEVKSFLSRFEDQSLYVKVGMELFYQEGPGIVSYIKEEGHSLFLDLKLHDIPNTVRNAMKGLARLGADMVNVHAAGGKRMMEYAIEGLESGTPQGSKRPLCIAVTQLTSTSGDTLKNEILIDRPLEETVVRYATFARDSGLDGVVCSSLEVPLIVKELGQDFMTITPGIRMASDDKNDQVRFVSPEQARSLGSTGIVVGRSITGAADPLAAYIQMKSLWEGEN